MARRTVEFSEGSFYHVYNRGVGRQDIFLTPDNYEFVMRKLSVYSDELAVKVVACCLMPNHYHFLLHQTGVQPAGLLAQRVFNSYTKALNKSLTRTGTLFESPYKAKRVDKNEYLSHLCWYVHSNPVSAGLVNGIADWAYSNYLECVGKRRIWPCDSASIEEFFGSLSGYEEFVRSYEVLPGQNEKFREYLLDE